MPFPKLITTIFNTGLESVDSQSLRRRLRLVNTVSSIFSFICAFYIPLFWYMGSSLFTIATLVCTISYACPVLLNYFKLHKFARIYALLHINVAVSLYSTYLGEGFNIQLALYPCVVLPFLYFERYEKKQILLFASFPPFAYLLHETFGSQFVIAHGINETAVHVFGDLMIFVTYISAGIGVWSLNEDARIAEAELRLLVDDKRMLLNIVCHDIANPLTLSGGGISLLKKAMQQIEPDKPIPDNLIAKLTQNSERISRAHSIIAKIVDNVRVIEANNQGKSIIALERVYLRDIFEDSLFVFADRLEQKNLTLEVINNLPNTSVLAEKISLTNSVINNLLSNAIKFSPEGSTIKIITSLKNQVVSIRIEDSGIGIPPDLKDKLFSSTHQTSRLGLQGEKGTGFGLPLVKSFVHRFGGRISVESPVHPHKEYGGSAFIITLKKA